MEIPTQIDLINKFALRSDKIEKYFKKFKRNKNYWIWSQWCSSDIHLVSKIIRAYQKKSADDQRLILFQIINRGTNYIKNP